MGFFSKLLGKAGGAPIETRGDVVTIRTAEIAEHLARPTAPNFSDAPMTDRCVTCGLGLREVFITTGGELGDPAVWRDHPIAVDGWACAGCGVFRYPRKVDPARIHELTEEGAARGRAGDFVGAELSFARIVWDWPGYFMGHMNYAEATRSRLSSVAEGDPLVARRLQRRMLAEYESAIEAFVADPNPSFGAAVARAYTTLAAAAIEDDADERALRFLDGCSKLEPLADEVRTEVERMRSYVVEGRSRFTRAEQAVRPYLRLMGTTPTRIETGDQRKAVVEAMESLSELVVDAPSFWQAVWLLAKTKEALGDTDGAIAVLRDGHARFSDAEPIAKDFGMMLVERGEHVEAAALSRAICATRPTATNLCNLAVSELLSGDLERAEAAIVRSLALDPADPIAKIVSSRIAKYRAGAPLPKSMADLQKG